MIDRVPDKSLEPRQGQDPLYDGEVCVCSRCNQPIYDNDMWYGEDEDGRAICYDCVDEEYHKLSRAERIITMGFDAVRTEKPTRILSSNAGYSRLF